jgi:hypothetical protein
VKTSATRLLLPTCCARAASGHAAAAPPMSVMNSRRSFDHLVGAGETISSPSAGALFRTLDNFLRATDQFDPDIVNPLIVDGTGLIAECLYVGR